MATVRRAFSGGYELDDDRERIDRDAVHAYLGGESYWAKGRSRSITDELVETASRVVGLFRGEQQVG